MDYYDLALDDSVFVTDMVIAALQEIDMIFNTEYTEVLGDPGFGTNFEKYLWNLNPDVSSLKNYVEGLLKNCYYVSKFPYTVDVEENSPEVVRNIAATNDVIYRDDSTYIIVIDLYGNDNNNSLAGKRYTTKIIQF